MAITQTPSKKLTFSRKAATIAAAAASILTVSAASAGLASANATGNNNWQWNNNHQTNMRCRMVRDPYLMRWSMIRYNNQNHSWRYCNQHDRDQRNSTVRGRDNDSHVYWY